MKNLIVLFIFLFTCDCFCQISVLGIEIGMSKSQFEKVIRQDARFKQIEATDFFENVEGETVLISVRDSILEDYSSLYAICFDSTSKKSIKYSGIGSIYVGFVSDKIVYVSITPPFSLDLAETKFWIKSAAKSSILGQYFKGSDTVIEMLAESAYKSLKIRPYMPEVRTRTVANGKSKGKEYIRFTVSNFKDSKNTVASVSLDFGILK